MDDAITRTRILSNEFHYTSLLCFITRKQLSTKREHVFLHNQYKFYYFL